MSFFLALISKGNYQPPKKFVVQGFSINLSSLRLAVSVERTWSNGRKDFEDALNLNLTVDLNEIGDVKDDNISRPEPLKSIIQQENRKLQ